MENRVDKVDSYIPNDEEILNMFTWIEMQNDQTR